MHAFVKPNKDQKYDARRSKLRHESSYVKVASVDIGQNDHILYTVESLHDTRGEYLRLKACDLKNKSLRIITKGLPPTKRVTSWAMRVPDIRPLNKKLLNNGLKASKELSAFS